MRKTSVQILVLLLVLNGLLFPAFGHVQEGKGKVLQIYSMYSNNTPVIDGSIATVDASEWMDAYVRNITLIDTSGTNIRECTLLLKNNNNTLYIGIVYNDSTDDLSDYISLYFDEGNNKSKISPVDRGHDDHLSQFNEDGSRIFRNGTILDYYWNGSAWNNDTVNLTGASNHYGGMHNFEFSIPLDTGLDNASSSDLNVDSNDEIGFFIELFESTSATRYIWKATNGWNSSIPGPELPELGNGWADLQLGLGLNRTLKSQYAAFGAPNMNDGMPISGDIAWDAVDGKNILMTDYNGRTIDSSIYTMENKKDLYIGVDVHDDDENSNDYLTVYQDRGSGSGDRDYILTDGSENANYLDAAGNYWDKTFVTNGWNVIGTYWGSEGGSWTQETYNISFVAGHPNVQLRFNFVSDGGGRKDGWYIDDVVISGDAGTAHTQNFDTGWGGWTSGGANNDWEVGNPGSGPNNAVSTPNCVATKLNGQYNNDENAYITSPVINLAGYKSATLTFQNWYKFKDNQLDFGYVEIYDGQGHWTDDVIAGDNSDGQGNVYYFNTPKASYNRYEFEYQIPMDAGQYDLSISTGDTIGLLLEFYDADTDTHYWWDQTTNRNLFITDDSTPLYSTDGWAELETGYPWISVSFPADNDIIRGTFNIWADAKDNVNSENVDYVAFSIDNGGWLDATAKTQTTWYYLWNTSNYNEGKHTINALAVDGNGQQWISKTISVIVDNHLPTLQIIEPIKGDILSRNTTLNITALEKKGILPKDNNPLYRLDGGKWKAMSGNDTYTISWNTSEVKDGPHTIEFSVRDEAGNVVTRIVNIIVDNTAPTCSISYPSNGQFAEGTIDIMVYAKDNIGLDEVNLSIDGAIPVPISRIGGGYYTYTIDTTRFSSGGHTLLSYCKDKGANNATSSELTLNIDNDAPEVVLRTPTQLYIEGVTELNVDVNESYLDTARYRIDDGAWNPLALQGSQYTGLWNTSIFPDGKHILTVEAFDMLGHTSDIINTFIIDNHAPTLQFTAPYRNQYIKGPFQFTAIANDEIGISDIILEIKGIEYRMINKEYYYYYFDTTGLPDGNYTANLTAFDAIGHSSSSQVDYRIDNNPPDIILNSPNSGELVQGNVPIDAVCLDTFLISCEYNINNGEWNDIDTWNTSEVNDGKYSIYINAKDASGKESTKEITVTVDNTPPVIISHYPETGSYLEGKTLLSAQIAEEISLKSVVFNIDGNSVDGNYNSRSGMYEVYLDTEEFDDGNLEINITAQDGIGHTSSEMFSVNIDNTNPMLDPRYPLEGNYIGGIISLSVEYTDVLEYNIDGGEWMNYDVPIDSQKLSDGEHTIFLKAHDDAGHIREVEIHLIVDNTPPVVSFLKPVRIQHLTDITEFELTIVEENLKSIEVDIDGMELTISNVAPFIGLLDTSNLTDGMHKISAKVSDLTGHTTVSEMEIFIDNSPPEVITNIKEGSTLIGNVRFRFNITDDTSVKNVFIRIDQGEWHETVSKDGEYSYLWPTSVGDNGRHISQLKVSDGLGNSRIYAYKVSVDNPDYWWLMPSIIIVLIIIAITLMAYKKKRRSEKVSGRMTSKNVQQVPTSPISPVQSDKGPLPDQQTFQNPYNNTITNTVTKSDKGKDSELKHETVDERKGETSISTPSNKLPSQVKDKEDLGNSLFDNSFEGEQNSKDNTI